MLIIHPQILSDGSYTFPCSESIGLLFINGILVIQLIGGLILKVNSFTVSVTEIVFVAWVYLEISSEIEHVG